MNRRGDAALSRLPGRDEGFEMGLARFTLDGVQTCIGA